MKKKCCMCGEVKDVGEFHKSKSKKDGYNYKCKVCTKIYNQKYHEDNKKELKIKREEYLKDNKEKIKVKRKKYGKKNRKKIREHNKKYQEKHKEELKVKHKEYYINNKKIIEVKKKKYQESHKEVIALRCKKYQEEHKGKFDIIRKEYYKDHREELIAKGKEYSKKNRLKINRYIKNRYDTDLNYKITRTLRGRFRLALNGKSKSSTVLKLVGCSIEFLIQYIEDQFTDGMAWDNWSLYGWHIDHIRPCASFDLTDPEQQRQCFNYTNLQPLWAEENLSKGAKYEEVV